MKAPTHNWLWLLTAVLAIFLAIQGTSAVRLLLEPEHSAECIRAGGAWRGSKGEHFCFKNEDVVR